MTDSKEGKKKIVDDWKEAFPELSAFSTIKLYKVIGPVVVGLELPSVPYSKDEYRIYFVSYPPLERGRKGQYDFSLGRRTNGG